MSRPKRDADIVTDLDRDYPAPDLFGRVCTAAGLPEPTQEHRFAPPRKWMFDYSWPNHGKVALEVEGGVWSRGRHTRGAGFLRDMEKYNAAVVLGWRLVRCTPDTLVSAATLDMLRALLHATGLFTFEEGR